MDKDKSISVVHLVWLPFGIELFKRFVNSYIANDPSYPHKLVIVFNGTLSDHPDKPEAYIEYLNLYRVVVHKFIYFDSGQDIETYKKTSKQIDTEFILFFNSFTQIRAAGWLRYYATNMDETVGVISATASLQSYYSSVYQKHKWQWENNKDFLYNFRKYKLFVKAFFYWRFLFKPFPNPHVRTTGFMVRRKQFIDMNFKFVANKFTAYQFENGRRSMTNYFLNKGLKVLVMDKNGETYEPHDWYKSSTFWINEQEKLLVSDNQTTIYENANAEERKSMTKLAWGK
jgi:hypothetical protein